MIHKKLGTVVDSNENKGTDGQMSEDLFVTLYHTLFVVFQFPQFVRALQTHLDLKKKTQ